jgi:hypothetical protein
MRAIAGIIAFAVLGTVGCTGSSDVERQTAAQLGPQAHADQVSVLTVEGMT